MDIKELKNRCLSELEKETQLETSAGLAGNRCMNNYHSGRKQIWHEVHDLLVRFFSKESAANKIVRFLSEEQPGIPGVVTEACRRACAGVDLDEEHFKHVKRQLITDQIREENNQ